MYHVMAGDNLWPPSTAVGDGKLDFKSQSLKYYAAMVELGKRLMKCFALALEVGWYGWYSISLAVAK
jgi:isopenicillin N synthase-like dioxygenase